MHRLIGRLIGEGRRLGFLLFLRELCLNLR
jgi:hypothetical protein